MNSTAIRSLAMAVVVMSAFATEAIPQTSQENAERLLDRLLQPESASSLENRRKAYRDEKYRYGDPEAARAANMARIEAARREKELQWERATPAERLILQQEEAAREAAAAQAVADAARKTAADAAACEAAEIAAREAADFLGNCVTAVIVMGFAVLYWQSRRRGGESIAHLLGRDYGSLAAFLRRVVTK